MRLKGKVAVITGCGPNINGGIAYGLADAGAKVVCADLDGNYAKACAKAIGERGGEALATVCDVSSEEDVLSSIAAARTSFGSIDVLVNGAVAQIRKGLLDVSLDEFRKQMDVCQTGAFLFTKHVAEAMIEDGRRGSIINIGSTEGHQGNIGNLAYGTAKGSLLHFTRITAMELAPYGIRVNSLSPTATDPGEGFERAAEWGVTWQPHLTEAPRRDSTSGDQGVPLGRRPSPRDYANAALFLASDDSEMMTGIDLRVDGGVISRYWRWNPGTTVTAVK